MEVWHNMTQIKLRRDTSANFTSKNPVLGVGEPAYETDTKKLKIGDGTTAYTQLEYFSAGGGSTDITATLPLKIVDGVISLEVDGQTIQIVDGKLHANLDELSNTVNTLSDDVGTSFDLINILQTDVQSNTESITNLQNEKEDVFKAIQPLVKTRTEINPVVGFTNNIGGKVWDSTTGSLELRDMSGTGSCLADDYGNDAQVIDSKLILKKYILIPYTQGQIVRIPAMVFDYNASYAVSLVNIDSNGNIDYISNCRAMERQQPNLNAKGSEYVQSSQSINAVTRISGAGSTGGYSSVKVTSYLTDSILFQLRVTDTKSTYALSIGRLSMSGFSCGYTSTDINVINRLKDVNALLLTRIGSTSSFAGIGVSESAPYDLSLIQVFEANGTTLETLTDPVSFVNSRTNIYDVTKNIINNSLSLNIGSGLSVVDGALTADTVTVDAYTKEQTNALLNAKENKITPVAPLGLREYIKDTLKGFAYTNDGQSIYQNAIEGSAGIKSDYSSLYATPSRSVSTINDLFLSYIDIPFAFGKVYTIGQKKASERYHEAGSFVLGKTLADGTFIPILWEYSDVRITTSDTYQVTNQHITFDTIKGCSLSFGSGASQGSGISSGWLQLIKTNTGVLYNRSRPSSNYPSNHLQLNITNATAIARLDECDTLRLVPSATGWYAWGGSAASAVPVSQIGMYSYSGTAPGNITWEQLGTNEFQIGTAISHNYLELSLGSGLSVVDGKLTSAGGITTSATGYQD